MITGLVKDVHGKEEIDYVDKKINFKKPWKKISVKDAVVKYCKDIDKKKVEDKESLIYIPYDIGALKNLRYLNLYGNNIAYIPYSIGLLENLELLQLGDNQIVKIPNAICNLKNLKNLYLFKNKIEELPECIGNLSNLEKLYLYLNKLDSTPESICLLDKLEYLYLCYNKIKHSTKLPDCFFPFYENIGKAKTYYNEWNKDLTEEEKEYLNEQGIESCKCLYEFY